MRLKPLGSLGAVSFVAVLLGCQNPEIVPISQDTYMLAKADNAGIFGNSAKMKAEVLRQASEFAAQRGMVAIPVTLKEVPIGFGRKATIEYQFKLVAKDSPEARNSVIMPRPDLVIEKNETTSKTVTTKNENDPKKDLYSELLKLDDLKKRGIITEEEFQAQKKKLLESKTIQ